MARMTTAELRGYQQICGADGAMMVIACDQRGGMRTLLAADPEEQARIGNDVLGDTKADITQYLASQACCVLVDPICAVPQLVDDGVIDRDTALLIGLDASGWDTSPEGYRLSKLVDGITARQRARTWRHRRQDHGLPALRHAGRQHPQHRHSRTGRSPISRSEDLLLVVEFLTYRLEGESPEAYAAKIPELIQGGTKICLDLGSKVLKLPYPGSAAVLRRRHAALRRRALGRAVRRRRPRDLPRPGRYRHEQRRFGRHRRPLAVEGLHLARPRRHAPAARDDRRAAAARIAGGDRQVSGTGVQSRVMPAAQ